MIMHPVLSVMLKTANCALRPIGVQLKRIQRHSLAERLEHLHLVAPNVQLDIGDEVVMDWIEILERGLVWLERLTSRFPVRVWSQDGHVLVSFSPFTLQLNTWEECMIAYEIFGESEYHLARHHRAIVIDFGMNVGLASLYFASQAWVESVYSYEPFEPTYAMALRNLKLNPWTQDKIEPHNFGVSDRNAEQSCTYFSDRKGCCGPGSLCESETTPIIGTPTTREMIRTRIASEEVERIRKMHPDMDLILKMDIEGGEGAVIQNLTRTGAIQEIQVILMEWHYSWPKDILDNLVKSAFQVHVQSQRTDDCGKIYAFKQH